MKAAIVGCGAVAHIHADALRETEGVTVAGHADICFERAQDFARKYGGNAYSSLDELLNAEKIDVLHICTPHNLHIPMLKAAAERNIAVFCEKPPLILAEERAALLEAQIPTGFCFQNRYNPEVLFLRERIAQAGAVRGARAFVTWARGAEYYSDWHGKKATEGGGVLINQAVHTLDLLVWMLGRPQKVSAVLSNHHLRGIIEVEDTAEVCLTYPDKRAVLFATTSYTQDAPVFLEVHCDDMTLRAEGRTITIRTRDGRQDSVTFPGQTAKGKGYWGAGHASCIGDFYRSLSEGKNFTLSAEHIMDTVDVLLAAYSSNGEIITI